MWKWKSYRKVTRWVRILTPWATFMTAFMKAVAAAQQLM